MEKTVITTGKLIALLAVSLILNLFYLISHFRDHILTISLGTIGQNTKQETQFYLCPEFRGGLGNLMFQYASVYGIAKVKGINVGLYPSAEINNVFNLSDHFISNLSICARATLISEKKSCMFDKSSFQFSKGGNFRHKSYLQSWKYFSNVEQDLRKRFIFSNYVRSRAETIMVDAIKSKFKNIPKNLTFIGVHVRRGDLFLKHNVNFGYQTADSGYISKSINYFRTKYKNTVFLVFTNPNGNDRKWCMDNIKGSDVILMGQNAREIDMCVLSKCNHTIMTVGSFGWWSGWLANGTTIYYKNVAKPGSKLEKEFSKDKGDYFYPTWIGM